MDEEIKKLVNDYVKEIEANEAICLSFKQDIDRVIQGAQNKMKTAIQNLDKAFEENGITEEEYLSMLREEKTKILQNAKQHLDSLLENIDS